MVLPGFFKIFLSHFSSEYMLIPPSYCDELPLVLPKTVLLQGSGGCFWKVAMLKKRDEVYFGQGWAKFVEDTRLRDGDLLTFVYDGSRNFKVSIYGSGGCKETRAVAQVIAIDDDKDDSVSHPSSVDANTSSEPEMSKTVPKPGIKRIPTAVTPEPEMAKTVPRTRNKGKKKVPVEDSDGSFAPEDSNSRNSSPEPEMAKTVPRTRNKEKKKVAVEDSDGSFISEDPNNKDSSYSPPTTPYMTPKVACPRRKGTSRSVNSGVGSTSYSSRPMARKRETVSTIKNPEAYLDDPKNLYFETIIKNRTYELLIHAQLVKDYCLKIQNYVHFIDNHEDGKLQARAAKWQDHRMCIKRWHRICKRNRFKKGDRLLCELFRKKNLVYAIKIHTVKGYRSLERD